MIARSLCLTLHLPPPIASPEAVQLNLVQSSCPQAALAVDRSYDHTAPVTKLANSALLDVPVRCSSNLRSSLRHLSRFSLCTGKPLPKPLMQPKCPFGNTHYLACQSQLPSLAMGSQWRRISPFHVVSVGDGLMGTSVVSTGITG